MTKSEDEIDACLICGSKKGRIQRGLCTKHHQAYHRSRKKLTPEGREQLEARLIAEGKLAPSIQGQRRKVENLFRIAAAELVSEHPEFKYHIKPPTLDEEHAQRREAMKKKAAPYIQAPGKSTADPKPRKNHG